MPKEFEGKVVVVSGGSRGIGRAIAIAFAHEGAQTVLAAANETNLAEGAKAVAAAGGPQAMTIAGDLRTLEACEQVFAKVNERFKRCDVLVNNAGATRGGNFFEQADALWIDGFALKFHATVRLTRVGRAMPGLVSTSATIRFAELYPNIVVPSRIESQLVPEPRPDVRTPIARSTETRQLLDVHFVRPLPSAAPARP